MNNQNILELTDVCKIYQQARDSEARVLNNVSLTVDSGQAIAIVAPPARERARC